MNCQCNPQLYTAERIIKTERDIYGNQYYILLLQIHCTLDGIVMQKRITTTGNEIIHTNNKVTTISGRLW
jgi:hypothetical protein